MIRIFVLGLFLSSHPGICGVSSHNEILFSRAQIAYHQNDWVQALHYLNQVLKDQEDHIEARLLRASIYQDQGSNSKAAKSYKSLLTKQLKADKKRGLISEKSLELSYQLAKAYFATYTGHESHEYAKANVKEKMISLFQFCLENNYLLVNVHYRLGYIYYLEKRKPESIKHLKQVMMLTEDDKKNEMTLLSKFYLSLQLGPVGHHKEAKLQLFSLLNTLKKDKHPLRDQIFASSIENLKRMADPIFSASGAITQSSSENPISQKDHLREQNKNSTNGSFTDLRLNLNYTTRSMRRWWSSFNLFLKQSTQDHARFSRESHRNLKFSSDFIYQKHNGKFHHFQLGYSTSFLGETGEKNEWASFSKDFSLGYKYEVITSLGRAGFQGVMNFISYQEGLPSDKQFFTITNFDFHPFSAFIDPYIELQFGHENIGFSASDSFTVRLNMLNSMTNADFLFQQSVFLEYFNFSRNGLVDLNLGLNLDLYYFLPLYFSSAINLGYSFEKEITSPVQMSNRRVNTYRLGFEFYF